MMSIGRMARSDATSSSERPERQQQSAHAAQKREHESFGEKLSDDTRSAAAQRETNCNFLAAGGPAREQHVRQVQTRDQQHHCRHSSQNCSNGGNRIAFRGIGVGAEPEQRRRHEGLVLLFNRKFFFQVCREAFERGGRRRGRDSRLEPADDQKIVHPAIGQGVVTRAAKLIPDFVMNSERQPDFRRFDAHCASETFRHDADDGERVAVEHERTTEERRIARVFLPIGVAHDYGALIAARLFFLR